MHTKGPWEARNVGGGMKVWKGIRIIADTTREPMPIEEAQANARLIAAAPDLLEALEIAFRGNITNKESELILKAIRKAKGE